MKGAQITIPPLFKCPISLDLFKDPVTLCTGQTYDRSCIEKWLEAGNLTCPVTMQKLNDTTMVPNHTLRHLIDQWIRSNNQIERTSLELTKDCEFSIAAMEQVLQTDESTLENNLEVLEKVHSLSKDLPFKNSCLIELNFIGVLLELVLRKVQELDFEESLRVVEKALVCVLKLMPFSDFASLNILKEEAKYSRFLLLFEKGNVSIKKSMCLLVEAISSSVETQHLGEELGKSVELLHEIIHFVQSKSEGAEVAIRAISALSLSESNVENLAREGAVQGLITYISSVEKAEGSLAPIAMSIIEKLLVVESAKKAIVDHPFGVDAIVKMVFRVSDHEGSESALNSLIIICSDMKSAREKAVECGVLTQLLLLLQSQCSLRAKTKARMLLKLLGSM